MWNVYRSDGLIPNQQPPGGVAQSPKTTGKAHPYIYEFVEVIQKEQTATEVFVLQLEVGARPPRRALKAINRDRKVQELKERFDTNKITLEEYVQGMSAHTNI